MKDPTVELNFTAVRVRKNPRDIKSVKEPLLALSVKDRKVYVGAAANYALRLRDISIDTSQNDATFNHRSRRPETSLTIALQTPKLKVEGILTSPSKRDTHEFHTFVRELEDAVRRVKGGGGGKTMPAVKDVASHAIRSRSGKRYAAGNTVTPIVRHDGLYMTSPRKSPGRRSSPSKQREGGRGRTAVGSRGNVVTAPEEEQRGMKLPPKSPLRAVPLREVEPKARAVNRSVFSRDEYEADVEEEPKRKRLVTSRKEEDDESDAEFDVPKAKKKLRLDDEEEEEEEGSPSEEDREVWMGMHSGIEGKEQTDQRIDEAKENAETETKTALVPTPAKQIHSFFAKHTAKPKPKPVANSDTFGGAILSSPQKSTTASTSTPPPSVTERAPAQTQRKTVVKSKYFTKNETGDTDYATDDECLLRDDDMYYEDERVPSTQTKLPVAPQRNILKQYGSKRVNNPYLRGTRSRLQYREHMKHVPIDGIDETPLSKQLDFDRLTSSADEALGSRKLSPSRFFRSTGAAKEIDEFNSSKPTTIPGIQNLGNTCYLSASLQTLFGIPNFLRDVYKMYEDESSKKEMPLTKSLLEVAVAIGVIDGRQMPKIDASVAKSKLSTSKAANPSALKKQMDVLTDKFVGYEQRDAHEFLSDLVDYLHEELVAEEEKAEKEIESKAGDDTNEKDVNAEDASSDKENDDASSAVVNAKKEETKDKEDGVVKDATEANAVAPTDDYFHLKVRVCLECDSCHYSRSKEELYRHLSLDVGEDVNDDPWTVKRGLDQFFQPERRELKCEKCSDGATATQTIEIISCPKALLLHFKRFIVTQEVRAPLKTSEENEEAQAPMMEMVLKKNKARIDLEESLSVPIFATEATYKLRGVVHHVGNTAFSGHYTSCGKRTDTDSDVQHNEEQWVYFDDRVGVKKDFDYVAGSEKNQRNCYMALYELK